MMSNKCKYGMFSKLLLQNLFAVERVIICQCHPFRHGLDPPTDNLPYFHDEALSVGFIYCDRVRLKQPLIPVLWPAWCGGTDTIF